MDNKLGEAINKAIQAHNFNCREEAQAEKREYIELVDSTVKKIIKEEKNVTGSLEAVVLTRSSSQPQSSYEAAATLSEFKLTKILIDKMEKNKSFDVVDYKRELYDALIKSYNTDKDIFESYGEVFTKKSLQAPLKTPPNLNISLSAKYAYVEEPSHTVEDSGMQQDQEFVMGDNDEQPADKEVTKAGWFKKPERPPTPDPDWSKRRQVDFRPPHTCISQVAYAEELPTSFDEFNDTSFDFSAFVINRLKILNLTQEILVGPAFNLLKSTCKSITELEYHLEECSKATTERLDWHNPENKPYPFNLRKPPPLIQDHRGRQIIPKDYFINKDLEYLKGGDLSKRYSTSVTKTKAATYELKCIKDLVPELWSLVQLKYDQHAYLGTSHWGLKRQSFYEYASNLTSSKDVYSERRIIAVTRLKIMKKYDYGHLEEIKVRRDDQKLYTFKEGDFKRLRLQDIEDMLLLPVQQKLTNLTIDERYNLNVALRMYTRRIVIQRRVEDLQLDHLKRKRLMRADELHKFSDGTLNDVWTALHGIDIDNQLYQRRLMWNLEKFIGGREYGKDIRLLERTI
ncbi:hypothetical protein Tco_0177876 [Tanacetum coccineum]